MGLNNLFKKIEPHFLQGGKLHSFYALYEAVATIFYTPPGATKGRVHVRDAQDLKRVMITVWLALLPVAFFGMWNVGDQVISAFSRTTADFSQAIATKWQYEFAHAIGANFTATSGWFSKFVIGATFWLPIYIVAFVVGGFWEVIFASIRKHEINEGFFVTSILFALILPPTIPLWQVALGISFGVIFAKEIFGGTGKNFLNPALTGRVFLFFAYPAQISGDAVWLPVSKLIAKHIDGYSGATPLGELATHHPLAEQGLTWSQAFFGFMPGSVGEVSAFLILIGGIAIMLAGIAKWRIVIGTFIGTIVISLILQAVTSQSNLVGHLPFYWHFVLGGWALGTFFMATDPVSASFTNKGQWIYGITIGVLAIAIRAINPAYPEGMMLAILFANLLAPLYDYLIVRKNISKRLGRS